MRAVAYIRVSDPSQVEGHSLNAQERLFSELCKARDWLPMRVYREEGRSARYEAIRKRPVFKQLLEDAAKGQFDVVVVHTLDRWARNLKVMLESLGILGQHNVGLVSITENIDYSTPHGKLATQMIGGMAEFFSDMLAVHVKKGIDERALQGKHLGAIPFGYESCWVESKGERALLCKREHPGGVHVHSKEGPVVAELFQRYATGTATLAALATWLNEQGFRTRNRHKLQDGEGNLKAEPRLFTTASVRGILHNPFFTGRVRHRDQLLPGLHESIVAEELFQSVQAILKRNSGRSETLQSRPAREYLLKGLIRCAYCMMPMWAQTYKNGRRYYREHFASRGGGNCVNRSGSIPCAIPDDQMGRIMSAIVLPDAWMDRLLAKIQLADEATRVEQERKKIEQRLKRLGQIYLDDLMEYDEYRRQKRQLEERLSEMVIPGFDAAEQAGKLLESLPKLWEKAELSERRRILMTMLDAVYVECKEERRIVAIKPKPAFRPLFEIATTKEESEVVLIKNNKQLPHEISTNNVDNSLCFWWRRGRPRSRLTDRFQWLRRHRCSGRRSPRCRILPHCSDNVLALGNQDCPRVTRHEATRPCFLLACAS